MKYLTLVFLMCFFVGAGLAHAEVTTSAVQGYKIEQDGSVSSLSTSITVEGAGSFGGNPYNSGQIPAGTYTVTSSVPTGYTVSYSTNPAAGASSYTTGSSVTLDLPAGGYKDLWFKYTPVVSNTAPVVSKGAVQGYKIDKNGSIFDPGATITVSGKGSFTQNPYNSGQIPAGTYTVTSSVPTGYTVSYSQNPAAGASSYVNGSSANVTIASGDAINLWFKYTSIATTPTTPVPVPTPNQTPVITPPASGLTVVRANKKEVLDLNNVYSPDIVSHGTTRYMYFGGWKDAGQTHDNIYRARCGNLGDNCRGIETLLDAEGLGFDHLNDPSVVKLPNGDFIMYMTGALPGDGFDTDKAKIYYSVADKRGAEWTAPTLLVDYAWVPTATVGPSGKIEMYANDTKTTGNVMRFRLGENGTAPETREPLVFSNGAFYLNPDVEYRPSLRLYQMFGERQGSKSIDYLTSTDGITFTLVAKDIATAQSTGVDFIRTPGQDSETAEWLYYAGTNSANAIANKIFFLSWKLSTAQPDATTPIPVPVPAPTTPVVPSPVQPPSLSGVYCPQITQDLALGSRGAQVLELQKFISSYYGIAASVIQTGYYGSVTQQYVLQFQRAQGLPALGVRVGPMTRAAISRVCESETSQSSVRIDAGFAATPVSGRKPLTVSFSAYSDGMSEYYIDFGDRTQADMERVAGICMEGAGGPCNGGADLTTSHVYRKRGTYNATLNKRYTCDATDGSSCIALESEQVGKVKVRVR